MSHSQADLTKEDRPSAEPSSSSWLHWLTLSAVVAAGFTLRIAQINAKPFWFDECFSAELARLNWSTFFRVLWWREANMTLYYLLLRAWMHLGQSESLIRALSVVFATATVPAVYWVAKLLYDRRVALLASTLFAFNAYSVRYSQEARSYALFVLLATLSSGFLVAYLRRADRRSLLCYTIISALAVYAHFYAILLVVAHWLTVRLFGTPATTADGIPTLRRLRRAWQIIGLAFLPLLVFVAKTGAGPIRWIQRPGVHDLWAFADQFVGAGGWPLVVLTAVAVLAALLPLWRCLAQRNQNWTVWRVQFLLVWIAFPVLLTFLLSFARPVFLGRYMIFCLPALVILAASGVVRLTKAWQRVLASAAFLFLATQGVIFVYSHDFDQERDGSGAATDFILERAQPGDGIIFDIAEARVPYEFFRSNRAGEDTTKTAFTASFGPQILFPSSGPGLQFQDFKAKLTSDSLRAKVSAHSRIWVFLIYNGTIAKPDANTTLLAQTLPLWFPHVERWQFPRVELRLYSKD
ncbi:MAG TPA: glycosyltransferase family 39 protein [Candidatus Sulfotelmatobacter sp.]|nr:glycosyltransferase family 39 protein [Candidatus Sulfotelmatobacter sp.]